MKRSVVSKLGLSITLPIVITHTALCRCWLSKDLFSPTAADDYDGYDDDSDEDDSETALNRVGVSSVYFYFIPCTIKTKF